MQSSYLITSLSFRVCNRAISVRQCATFVRLIFSLYYELNDVLCWVFSRGISKAIEILIDIFAKYNDQNTCIILIFQVNITSFYHLYFNYFTRNMINVKSIRKHYSSKSQTKNEDKTHNWINRWSGHEIDWFPFHLVHHDQVLFNAPYKVSHCKIPEWQDYTHYRLHMVVSPLTHARILTHTPARCNASRMASVNVISTKW